MARIVIEEECRHGFVNEHYIGTGIGKTYNAEHCPGGSRRVLDPGSYVLIEKVDGEWPAEAKRRIVNDMHGRHSIWYDTVDRLLDDLRDALAGGEQP